MITLACLFRRALLLAAACAITIAAVGVDATAQVTLPERTVLEQRVISFLDNLNLTETQRAQIETILREERPLVEPLLRQFISLHDELRETTRGGRFDEAKIRALVARMTPTIAELIVARERIIAKFHQVLTPAQRALLEQRRAELWAKLNGISFNPSTGSGGGTLLEAIGSRLALSPQQQLALILIMAVEYPRIETLITALTSAQDQMRAVTENGRFDEAQVRPIAIRQAQTIGELIVATNRIISKLYGVLTPAQRTQLEGSLDEWAARLRGLLDIVSIDDPRFFVRQHYLDFLSREPEREGFEAWVAVLDRCGSDGQCMTRKRTEVSGAFFRSHEFQLKGYFAYRFYRASFGRLPKFAEIMPDMRSVTGQTAEEVKQKRDAFAAAWVARAEFRALYDGLSNAAFVDKLLTTAGVLAARRDEFISALDSGQKTRAQVVREIVESNEFFVREYNGAFVAMQYFGYLRRDPEAAGYQNWLRYLNQNPSDYQTMVWGFVASTEYRRRFGN
jgi:Spy/CpxP family protein refolding chaperone